MADQRRANIMGPFQPKWIDRTGLGLLVTSVAVLFFPRRSR